MLWLRLERVIVVSLKNSSVFTLIVMFGDQVKGQNLIERLVWSNMVRVQLSVCAVFASHLLRCGDILKFGDNSERAIANDAQPMPEQAEEYIAYFSRPTY